MQNLPKIFYIVLQKSADVRISEILLFYYFIVLYSKNLEQKSTVVSLCLASSSRQELQQGG